MFTGIVRERGRVVGTDARHGGLRLRVHAPRIASEIEIGDSVSVSGCCLTAVEVGDGTIAFDVVPESLARTSLGALSEGSHVNVEPALRAGEPLGGHYVQGHVDAVGRVRSIEADGLGARVRIDLPPELLRYCVEKGSIAVEGTSLTIAALDEDGIEVALVPHTLAETTLGVLAPGAAVNVEADVLAKYVERLVKYDGADAARADSGS